MKKIISILMCIAMFFSMFSLSGYAFEVEDEFNISDYSWDDIMTMSNSDFRQLLADFERVYDPFDTYETNPIMAKHNDSDNSNTIQPRWTSGNAEHTETGSHELITARACSVLLNDKGFWGANENGSIIIALTLSLASILPDTEANLGRDQLFAGHFYDPDTQENWMGHTSNTARDNASSFYDLAVANYSMSLDTDFIECVGKMLHYVQDACVPHHAANVTGLNPSHSAFESYADDHLDSYIGNMTSINNSTYLAGLNNNVGIIVHNAAIEAKSHIEDVNNVLFQREWGDVAEATTRAAVTNSAVVLYKLSIRLNIPLTR